MIIQIDIAVLVSEKGKCSRCQTRNSARSKHAGEHAGCFWWRQAMLMTQKATGVLDHMQAGC
jgi:hypothetical protein